MLENKVTEAVQSAGKSMNDPKIKDFEKAYGDFKNLVKKGFAKERGYNLFSLNSGLLERVQFNAKPKSDGTSSLSE